MPKSRPRPASRKNSADRRDGQTIILEEIRSQNRATIEAVEAARVALETKIDQVDRDSQARDAVLVAAVRQNSTDIRKNSDDIRVLEERVAALGPLDQRVSALERRLSGKP